MKKIKQRKNISKSPTLYSKVESTKVLSIFCCSKIGKKKWGQSFVNIWLPSLFFANFTATKDEKYCKIEFVLFLCRKLNSTYLETVHRFGAIAVYVYGSIVHFAEGLNFKVVTLHTQIPFPGYIFMDIFSQILWEVFAILLLK